MNPHVMARKKNTGIDFELLVRSMFQEIIDTTDIQTISVEHNVQVKGKSGLKHQIDVLWDFEIGDVVYKTVIQAKDWSVPVKKEQVLAFKSILEDIPGQPRGYMVTSKNFQSGGKAFADFHGIKLFLLREVPKPEPIRMVAGTFARFYANLKEGTFDVTPYNFNYSIKFRYPNSLDEEVKSRVKTLDKINIWQCKLFDSDSNEIGTLGKLMSDKTRAFHADAESALEEKPVFRKDCELVFHEPTVCSVRGISFQIDAVFFTTDITKGELIKTPFMRPGVSRFILRDILDGKETEFDVTKVETC